MSEYITPQQTPENIEHIGFMSRAMQFARNAYHAAAERAENYDYRRPMVYGSILALGGLAGGLKGATSLAQETAAGGPAPAGDAMPNVWDIVHAERAKAIAENPTMTFIDPDEEMLKVGVRMAAGWSSWDDLTRVTVSHKAKSLKKVKVDLKLLNRRGVVRVANLRPSAGAEGGTKKYNVSFDGDIFSEESVIATPMLRPTNGSKPRQWGKSVVVPSRDVTDPAQLSRVEVDHYTQSDGKYSRTVYVKPKALTSAILKSGRFYVDINQGCNLRDESYDSSNGTCDKSLSRTFRVNPSSTTSYIPGRPSKPGDVYVYQKKQN